MNDKSGGEGGKRGERARGGGGRGPGGPSKGGPPRGAEGGFKPGGPKRFGRSDAKPAEGGRERSRAPRSPGRDGERKPFRSREERPRSDRPADATRSEGRSSRPRAEGAEARGERKPFTPKSRGMVSHGGREADGAPKRPRSYGRLNAEAGATGERSHRPDRAKREGRPEHEELSPRTPRSERERPARRAAEAAVDAQGTMRIAKRLARAGIASRRDAEGMIADGRVKLNGKVLDSPAIDVSAADRIEIDNAPLPAIERTRLWLFHKPAGLVTTNRDPEGRPTVFDRLPEEMPRVLSIGRLDINTEGLLLLTNDGGLARILELPATGWLRRYRVRAHGAVTQAQLDELRQGVAVEGVFYGAIEATLDREQGSNVWLTLGLREGKNREVKKILGHLGLEVNRLIRVSFGPFQLGELGEGAVLEIKGRMLRDQLGERLIEEAGADFDAPIVNTFSNKPVTAEKPREEKRAAIAKEWISASDSGKPNRRKFGAAKREDALGRLETRAPRGDRPRRDGDRPERGPRPERGDKPFSERKPRALGDRREKPEGDEKRPPRPPVGAPKRTANIWMAPGARALGPKGKAEREERDRLKAEGGPSRSPRPSSGPRKPSGPKGPGGEQPRSRPGSGAPRRPTR